MAISIDAYFQYVVSDAITVWSDTSASPGTWMIVVHGASGGQLANMGGDPGAKWGWPPGSWQLLAEVDAGPGLPKLRAWAVLFVDGDSRTFELGDGTSGIDVHSHVYFLSGVRPGTDAADLFMVGGNSSATASATQQLPLYTPDPSGTLIGAWISGTPLNYSSLGGLTARAELDSTSSTSVAGDQALIAAGVGSRTATATAAAPWAAVSIAARPDLGGAVTFPQQPLGMKLELALGANPNADPAYWAGLWTDITGDAQPRGGGVSITRGRQDETSNVSPSSMTVTLNNAAGRYVRLNPNGPYYGKLSKNTPARLWVNPGDGWRVRYTGFVSEWPPRSQGGQVDENMPIRVDGPTRRLSRGKVLNSAIRKAIVQRGNAAGYWPLETDGASALTGGIDMRLRGGVSFGSGGPSGSAGEMTAPWGSAAYSTITGMPTTNSWQVSVWLEQDAGASDVSPVICWTTPNSIYGRWFCYANNSGTPGQISVEVYQHTSPTIVDTTGPTDIRGMGPVLVTVRATNSGSNVRVSLFINGVLDTTNTVSSDAVAAVTNVGVNNLNFGGTHVLQGKVDHLYVSAVDPALSDSAFASSIAWLLDAGTGHTGERATDRIRRISNEEGVPVVIVGDDGTSQAMGPQPVNDFLDVLRDCETADGGVLYERRDGRLAYQTRAARYNAAPALTLDYAAGHVAPPLEPTDDDQHIVNDFTATRSNGGSARVYDQTSIDTVGQYADSGTVNVADDDQLLDQAGWRVHLGTADDLRYPSLVPNLNGRPELIADWLAVDVGAATAVTNPGRDLPPGNIAAFAEGYTETLDTVAMTAAINASPGKPWQVILLDDDTLGRLDTAGTELAAAATSTATSISVAPVTGPNWTLAPADLPFTIIVGGEEMTVTAVAPYATDTFARTASSGWGTADTGQTWTAVVSPAPASDYSVSGGQGRHSLSAVNQHMFTTIPNPSTYFDIRADLATDKLAVGSDLICYLVGRFTNVSNYYMANVGFTTAQAVALTIRRNVAGTETHLAGGIVSGLTHAASTRFGVRFRGDGTLLRAKVWLAADPEPDDWDVTVTDANLTSGAVGFRSLITGGYTGTLPVLATYDNVTVNPQTFTVTRSVNGVVCSHTAGEDVRLATAPILSL